jgi:hypothetical protein
MNRLRGNHHINKYKTDPFCKFIKDIIPRDEVYNKIMDHSKKTVIKDVRLYNKMCNENEEKYKENFIKCLF